jgi:hypothetical protein
MVEQVRLSSGEPGGPVVVLSQPFRPFADEVLDVHVRITGTGLGTDSWVRTIAGDGLPEFVHDLVRDFRGWTGLRTWSSLEGDLSLAAQHTGARVLLEIRLAPDAAGWAVTATVALAPGEELTAVAVELTELLH